MTAQWLTYVRYDLTMRIKKSSSSQEDDVTAATIVAARRDLRHDLDKWRRQQLAFMPRVDVPDCKDGEAVDDDDEEGEEYGKPEEEPLALPSDFNTSEHQTMGLETLALFERQLRVGRAYDLIESIRESLNHRAAFLEDKQKHARGQKENTRAQYIVNNAADHTKSLATIYNLNRRRLQQLYNGDMPSELREINMSTDLVNINIHHPRSLGDSRAVQSWIFNVIPPGSTAADAASWQIEGKYFLYYL